MITREKNEIDEVMQARYLDFLEQQFETNFLEINDTMNDTQREEVLLMREHNDL